MTSDAFNPIQRLLEERLPIRQIMVDLIRSAEKNWLLKPDEEPLDWDALCALDFEGEFLRCTDWIYQAFKSYQFPPEVNGLYISFICPPVGDRVSTVAYFVGGSRDCGTNHNWAKESQVPADEFIHHPAVLLELYRRVAFANGWGDRERAINLVYMFLSLVVAEWSRTAVRHVLRGEAPERRLFVGYDPWMGFNICTLQPERVGDSGSILVSWSGTIAAGPRRAQWHDLLRQIANWHECRWQQADVRPGFRSLAAMRGQPSVPARPPLRWLDEELSGRILVDADLAGGADALRREAARHGLEIEEVEIYGRSHPLLVLRSLTVRGVDFRAFDLRVMYPTEDRLSFYLLESDEAPFLNGRVAAVDDRAFNQKAFMKPVANADWYVRAPSVHLREFFEEWTSELLALLRWAFAPDFQFEHREDVVFRAPRLAWQCECLEETIGREAALDFGLKRLRQHFDIEADRVERHFGW